MPPSTSLSVAHIVARPRAELEPAIQAVRDVLDRMPSGALEIMADAGMRIQVLGREQRYRDVSGALRRLGVQVDAWPTPPAGLFVVEEGTVYLRSVTPMTIAHECGHALDCALGGGVYRSGYDAEIRDAFCRTTTFVTPYAAAGLDEYFAESLRAFIEVNDSGCPWPSVTRERLRHSSPQMAAWFEREIGQVAEVAA